MSKANGKVKLTEELYLKYTTNALVEFEDETGQEFLTVATKMERGNVSFKMLRALVWAGLIDSDDEITVEKTGDIIDEVGFEKTLEKAMDAIQAMFPNTKEQQAKNLKKVVSQ